MHTMDTPNTLIRQYKVMFNWLALLGLQWNGMEISSYKNKILYFVVRHFYLLCWLAILLYLADVLSIAAKEVAAGNISSKLAPVLMGSIGMITSVCRLWIFKFKGEEILEVFNILDQILVNHHRNKKMTSFVIKNRIFVNSLAICVAAISAFSSMLFFIKAFIKLGRSAMPSILEFIDDGIFLVMYQLTVASITPFIMSGFTVFIGSILGTLAGEMTLLQDDLADIFDAVQADPLGSIVINKKVIDESESENGKRLKAQKFRECDKLLSAWIDRHVSVVQCSRKVSVIVRWPLLLFYVQGVAYATSLIFTSLGGKYPLSLMIFTLLSYGTVFVLCNMGQNLLNKSASVASDALGKCYFLYPLRMQKALKLTLAMSQKPLQVNIMGLYPLSLETFFAMHTMDTPSTLIRQYKLMFNWLALLGLQWNGMENFIHKNRTVYFVVRHFYMLCWLSVLLYFADVLSMAVRNAAAGNFSSKLAPAIMGSIGMIASFFRLWIIKFKGKEILEVFNVLDQILFNRARSKKMTSLAAKNRIFVNSLTVCVTAISVFSSTYFMIGNALRLGRSAMPSIYEFIDDGKYLVMYQLTTGVLTPFIMSGLTFLVGSTLGTLADELTLLQGDLADIFDAVQADPLGSIVINKKVIDESESENAKRFMAQKFRECDKNLSTWIDRHAKVVECSSKLSFILRWPLLFFYAQAVAYATSLIFTSLKGKYPFSLSIFTLVSYFTVFSLCIMGQNLLNKSASVASDALGKCYFLYPLRMQKALKLILAMSQKPMQVNIMGLYPLSLKTFFALTQFCYTIISFMAGFSVNVE